MKTHGTPAINAVSVEECLRTAIWLMMVALPSWRNRNEKDK